MSPNTTSIARFPLLTHHAFLLIFQVSARCGVSVRVSPRVERRYFKRPVGESRSRAQERPPVAIPGPKSTAMLRRPRGSGSSGSGRGSRRTGTLRNLLGESTDLRSLRASMRDVFRRSSRQEVSIRDTTFAPHVAPPCARRTGIGPVPHINPPRYEGGMV